MKKLVKTELKKEIKNRQGLNENASMRYSHLSDTVKAVLRGMFTTLSVCVNWRNLSNSVTHIKAMKQQGEIIP